MPVPDSSADAIVVQRRNKLHAALQYLEKALKIGNPRFFVWGLCPVAPPREEEQDDSSYVVSACEAFHTGVFALGVGLSGAQWNSLDGTTMASKEAMREKMKSLIEQ